MLPDNLFPDKQFVFSLEFAVSECGCCLHCEGFVSGPRWFKILSTWIECVQWVSGWARVTPPRILYPWHRFPVRNSVVVVAHVMCGLHVLRAAFAFAEHCQGLSVVTLEPSYSRDATWQFVWDFMGRLQLPVSNVDKSGFRLEISSFTTLDIQPLHIEVPA